jgi:hypothetical protein
MHQALGLIPSTKRRKRGGEGREEERREGRGRRKERKKEGRKAGSELEIKHCQVLPLFG